ncbi:galactokinase [candidate division KSB1 bacterium]
MMSAETARPGDEAFFLPPHEYLAALDDPGSAPRRDLTEVYGGDKNLAAAALPLYREVLTGFKKAFPGEESVAVMRSTGRVNLLGMHSDHRGGSINTIAVHELLMAVSRRTDDRILIHNADPDNFPPRQFSIAAELPAEPVKDWEAWTRARYAERRQAGMAGDWSNYIKAPALYIQDRLKAHGQPLLTGFNCFVTSNLPRAAGLSSSSALVVGTAETIIYMNGLSFTDSEFVDCCGTGEWFVGTRGGKGDHASILFGRPATVNHISFFPLGVEPLPFPAGHRVILCNSLVEAKKSAGARDVFNDRVCSYEVGLKLIKRHSSDLAPRLEHLRDLDPARLGLPDADVLQLIRELPEIADRNEIRRLLPGEDDFLERLFDSHREPAEGYRVRAVCLYGVAAISRSEVAADLLKKGDLKTFGQLMYLSHDGDRVTGIGPDGRRRPFAIDHSHGALDIVIGNAREGAESAKVYRQPGGYAASVPELDEIVDTTRNVPGVLGASVVGAGLGGNVIVLAREASVEELIDRLDQNFYGPRGVAPAVDVCYPLKGSGFLRTNA